MLTINYEFRKGILFVRLCGELSKSTSNKLKKEITEMLEDNGISNVVFNISNLLYIDEIGIDNLYYNYLICKKNRGNMLICCPSSRIKNDIIKNKFNNFKFIENELNAFEKIII